MLRKGTLHLSQLYDHLSLVARSAGRLERIVEEGRERGGSIYPVSLDYRRSELLGEEVDRVIDLYGPVDLLLSWIHASAPEAFGVVASVIERRTNRKEGGKTLWYEVLGSAVADPAAGEPERERLLAGYSGIDYRSIVLGFEIEGERSRWLTHDEISAGVIDAVHRGRRRSIVGRIEPWERRP